MSNRIYAGVLGGGKSQKIFRGGCPKACGLPHPGNAITIPAQTQVTFWQVGRGWPVPEIARKLCCQQEVNGGY